MKKLKTDNNSFVNLIIGKIIWKCPVCGIVNDEDDIKIETVKCINCTSEFFTRSQI